jgi:hypothetical protein
MNDQNYDLYEELGSLSALLRDYHRWFFAVLDRAAFGGPDEDLPAMPSLLIDSLSAIPREEAGKPLQTGLEDLERLHHRLKDLAALASSPNSCRAFRKPARASSSRSGGSTSSPA